MRRIVEALSITLVIVAVSLYCDTAPVVLHGQSAAPAKPPAPATPAPAPKPGSAAAPKPAPAAARPAPKPGTRPPAIRKTSWGDPDLQGTWDSTFSFDWGATFERDPKYGGRAELTDEELAERQRQAAEAQRTDPDAIPAGGGGTAPTTRSGSQWLGGGYNAWWLDQGTVNRQTSQVVDPPDGRLPPRTPAGQAAADTARRKPRIAESWEDLTLWERCLSKGGMPNIMFPRG